MGEVTDRGALVYRDFAVPGLPASGDNKPAKQEIRGLFAFLDGALANLLAAFVADQAVVVYSKLSSLTANVSPADRTLGIVYNDTAGNNGIYIKSGAAGTGGWVRTGLMLAGERGQQGERGPTGKSFYQSALDTGYVPAGTSEADFAAKVAGAVAAAATSMAVEAQQASQAARDAALQAGRTFETKEEGVAGSTDGQYFVVPGNGAIALTQYRRVAGAAVPQAPFPSLAGLAPYGTVAQVAANVQTNQATSLNATLADPTVKEVRLPSGTIWVSETVRAPANTVLVLQPDTVIKALPSFAIQQGRNHLVLLEGSGAGIKGGLVDANKVGLGGSSGDRINGVTVLNGARDCFREDLTVQNCTGYAVYDSGSNDLATPPSSSNRRLKVFNSQIHYEAQGADGTTYEDCTSGDGDGDIPCLSWVHPLVGSKNLAYRRCTGKGQTPAAWDVQANVAALENISVLDCHYELTNSGAIGFSVPPGNNPVRNLLMSTSSFVAPGGIAVSLQSTTGSFSQVTMLGGNGMEATSSDVECTGCDAIGQRSGGTMAAFGVVESGGRVRWNGGSLTGSGPSGSAPSQGNVAVSADTLLTPAPAAPPRPTIIQELVGQVAPVVDGPNTTANVFPPQNVANPLKVSMSITVRGLSAGFAAAPIPTPTFSQIDTNFYRIYFAGVALDPAVYSIAYHFIEVA